MKYKHLFLEIESHKMFHIHIIIKKSIFALQRLLNWYLKIFKGDGHGI